MKDGLLQFQKMTLSSFVCAALFSSAGFFFSAAI